MNAGARIICSGELIEQVWMQVEDMAGSLSGLTETALENGEFAGLRSAGVAKPKYEQSASGWSTTSYGISFPVMEKKRRKSVPAAWINYQISVFGGGHWGKVNTFNMPGFVAGTTVVTQQQFDYYTNSQWKVNWAYGVKLDLKVVLGLFGTGTASSTSGSTTN